MQVSAKTDYAVRALVELAAAGGERRTRDELANAQRIPPRYLEAVLTDLRRAGMVVGQRGASGGYELAVPAGEITIAEVARAVDGPLSLVQGQRPETVDYVGVAAPLGELWVGVRAAVRSVLEQVTVEDVRRGRWPRRLRALLADPDAWRSR